jgi:hypothetical protein
MRTQDVKRRNLLIVCGNRVLRATVGPDRQRVTKPEKSAEHQLGNQEDIEIELKEMIPYSVD